MQISEVLIERYVNLIGDTARKQQYKDQIYHMVQQAYRDIGGIRGSGFASADDMVASIPFWKIATVDGQPVAVKLYKDKQGRKSVAAATDGSAAGKQKLAQMIRDDLLQGRSYAELSKAALAFARRSLPPEISLRDISIPLERVQQLVDDPIRQPPADDPESIKHPDVADRLYQREIGGVWVTKLMLGTPGLTIQQ